MRHVVPDPFVIADEVFVVREKHGTVRKVIHVEKGWGRHFLYGDSQCGHQLLVFPCQACYQVTVDAAVTGYPVFAKIQIFAAGSQLQIPSSVTVQYRQFSGKFLHFSLFHS